MMKSTKIKVSCDSNANIKSCNTQEVDVVEDLEFDSRDDWDAASDEKKMQAVTQFWNENGIPEIYWDDR